MSSKRDLKDEELQNVSGGAEEVSQAPDEAEQTPNPQLAERPGGARLRPGHDYKRD